MEFKRIRRRLFEQQCKSLLQTVKWLSDGRVKIAENRVLIEGARFTDFEFSPAADDEEALQLKVPSPDSV